MKYKIHQCDGKEIVTSTHVVHTFVLNDVEDPDLYAAEPIWKWQQSDAGKWVMENAIETPSWHRNVDYNTYGYLYQVRAELTPEQYTYFSLRFK